MKPIKCLIAVALVTELLIAPVAAIATPGSYAAVLAPAVTQSLNARAAVLVDAGTGQVLINRSGDQRLPIASITKLMTLLLVLEANRDGRVQMTDAVVATPHACSYGGSQIYLEPGERFTLKEMLMAVAIKSANDAAIALAEHVAGSEAAFVVMMNQRAAELGMLNTNFINACGLDGVAANGANNEASYSSAADVAILSRALLHYHSLLREWLTTRITYLQRPSGPVELFNTNHRFLAGFQGADGLKTGLTDEAGWCLSATAERGKFRLIAVVLGAPSDQTRFQDVASLLNYGFANFLGQQMVRCGEQIAEVHVSRGASRVVSVQAVNDLSVILPKGQSIQEVKRVVELLPDVQAPIALGQKLGRLQLQKGDQLLGEVDLVASEAVNRLGFFGNWQRLLEDLLK